MGVTYQAIGWNRQKKIYDGLIAAGCLIYTGGFVTFNLLFNKEITFETLLIRASSTLAFLLLQIILMIGPLTRIDPRFLPLLYNRRHLGVTMFTIAAVHGLFSILQFHSLGNVNPFISLFVSNTRFASVAAFPFQALGFFALVILLLMAATSHDFWLHNLGPRLWKTLHMMVYLAYFLILMHILLGVIQYETSPVFVILVGASCMSLLALHLFAGLREKRVDKSEQQLSADGFIKACSVDEIMEDRGKVICLGRERVAVYRTRGMLYAVSNVCKHQLGPIGEGKIIDGCITCPWHGYQYLPNNGQSPPPFKEKLSTYDVKLVGNTVWVNPAPYPEGTERPGASITSKNH